mgnify:CR=1 FL=1
MSLLRYVFRFDDAGAAERDPVVGSLSFLEVLIFGNVRANSVVSNPGFWCLVAQDGDLDPVLLTHEDLQLVFDQVGRVCTALFSLIPVEHINIIVNAYSNYVPDGLTLGTPLSFIAYGTEDGSHIYGTETGADVYVPE